MIVVDLNFGDIGGVLGPGKINPERIPSNATLISNKSDIAKLYG
jgi:hypothetical protein